MKNSNFNIVLVRMKHVDFDICNDVFQGMIDLETQISSRYAIAENVKNRAKVEMMLRIFPTSTDAPFRINIEMEGIFEWNENFKKSDLKNFLEINGNAVLYSYARPILTQLTTSAGFDPLVMPLMNFVVNDKNDEHECEYEEVNKDDKE